MEKHEDILLWLKRLDIWVVTLVGTPRVCNGFCYRILRFILLKSWCLLRVLRRRHSYRLSSTTKIKVDSSRYEEIWRLLYSVYLEFLENYSWNISYLLFTGGWPRGAEHKGRCMRSRSSDQDVRYLQPFVSGITMEKLRYYHTLVRVHVFVRRAQHRRGA